MKKANSAMNWTIFFRAAGIPDAASLGYCQSFVKNRIQQSDLQDLDKETLTQLGVKAIGDQLAILRHIKKEGAAKTQAKTITPLRAPKSRIEAPDSSSSSTNSDVDVSLASYHRKGRPPPDSHEIYHVKMPQGTTARTRKILLTAQRKPGAFIRGTTGVRQGGQPVEPIDKTSIAVQNMRTEHVIGHKRIIQQHLGQRQGIQRMSERTLTVTLPERQERSRITFGESTGIGRTIGNRPIGKVMSGSRIAKRIGGITQRRNISDRISYSSGQVRGSRVYVDDQLSAEMDEGVMYEDDNTEEQSLYMEEEDGYVEYVEQSRGNIFNRVTY